MIFFIIVTIYQLKSNYNKAMYTYYCISEPHNGGPGIDKITSYRPLDFQKDIIPYYEKEYEFDWERDSLTFIEANDVTEIKIP